MAKAEKRAVSRSGEICQSKTRMFQTGRAETIPRRNNCVISTRFHKPHRGNPFVRRDPFGKKSQRVLVFPIKPEHGKTYLMYYFLDYCRRKHIPVGLVDFDQRGKDPISYWKFAGKILDEFDSEHFPNVNMCERRQPGGFPLVDYHPEAGGGGITVSGEQRLKNQSWRIGQDVTSP